MVNKISRTALAGMVTSVLLLQGCASAVVKDSDRDQSGMYDGKWQARMLKGPGLQYVGNWHLTCEQPGIDFDLMVEDGQVAVSSSASDSVMKTNIDSRGKFSFVVPMKQKASASGSSDSPLVNGNVRLILNGKLTDGVSKGKFVVGIQQFGWQGCTNKVLYERVPEGNGDLEV